MGIATDYFKMRNKSRPQLQKELPEVMATVASMVQETYKDGALSHQQTGECIYRGGYICRKRNPAV